MFRVLVVVDKKGTAIDRLARGQAPYQENIDYQVVAVHPKRPDEAQLNKFLKLAKVADVIDYQYFRTAEMLRQRYQWLLEIPSLLTHHNPYSITESSWGAYQAVIGINKTIYQNLQKLTPSRVEYIPHHVNPYFWRFQDEYSALKSVIMVANRIEAKKGILPVAQACKQIGAKMYLVGSISDPEYFRQVMATGAVEFAQEITDEELRQVYYKSGIHVCNSVDNFESGTLPILEAIFCGVPVLTRSVGQVPDIKSDDNMVVGNYEPEDVAAIASHLEEMFSDKKKLEDMRHEAWFSIKDRHFERRAYAYQKIYRELLPRNPVSVIVPVADREEITRECLSAIVNQTYPNIEIIIADDGDVPQREFIESYAQTINNPLRYIRLGGQSYNLAQARNRAVIEATSDILVFCDQRQIMEPNAVLLFVDSLKPRHWLYGNKGGKKDFVENFSCVYREDLVTMGLFNERIVEYGGMSQEIRGRGRRQGIIFEYIEEAKAHAGAKSSNRRRKKFEIMRMKTLLWKLGIK